MPEGDKKLNYQDLKKVTGGASPITAIDPITYPAADNLKVGKVVISDTKVGKDGNRYIVK